MSASFWLIISPGFTIAALWAFFCMSKELNRQLPAPLIDHRSRRLATAVVSLLALTYLIRAISWQTGASRTLFAIFGTTAGNSAISKTIDVFPIVSLLLVAWMVWAVIELFAMRRRVWPLWGCCAICGYDLRGVGSDRCPECGSRA